MHVVGGEDELQAGLAEDALVGLAFGEFDGDMDEAGFAGDGDAGAVDGDETGEGGHDGEGFAERDDLLADVALGRAELEAGEICCEELVDFLACPECGEEGLLLGECAGGCGGGEVELDDAARRGRCVCGRGRWRCR